MDLFDYSYYESGSFIDSAPPPDFRVQRTPCRGLNPARAIEIFFIESTSIIQVLQYTVYCICILRVYTNTVEIAKSVNHNSCFREIALIERLLIEIRLNTSINLGLHFIFHKIE